MKYGMLFITIPIGLLFIIWGVIFFKGKIDFRILISDSKYNPSSYEVKLQKKKNKIGGLIFIFAGILSAFLPLIIY